MKQKSKKIVKRERVDLREYILNLLCLPDKTWADQCQFYLLFSQCFLIKDPSLFLLTLLPDVCLSPEASACYRKLHYPGKLIQARTRKTKAKTDNIWMTKKVLAKYKWSKLLVRITSRCWTWCWEIWRSMRYLKQPKPWLEMMLKKKWQEL